MLWNCNPAQRGSAHSLPMAEFLQHLVLAAQPAPAPVAHTPKGVLQLPEVSLAQLPPRARRSPAWRGRGDDLEAVGAEVEPGVRVLVPPGTAAVSTAQPCAALPRCRGHVHHIAPQHPANILLQLLAGMLHTERDRLSTGSHYDIY